MELHLVEEIADFLIKNEESIAVAESCTGGRLSAALTSINGASSWMKGSITAYTEATKRGLLQLTDEELSRGLVTKACALGMVNAISKLTGSSYAISSTGVCGSESEGFLPCTAWIGLKTPHSTNAFLIEAPDKGRIKNMEQVVEKALELMLERIREEAR